MVEYESLVLYRSDLGEDGLQAATEKTKEILGSLGGEIHGIDEWGVRELAYPIQGQRRGVYVLFGYGLEPESVRELDRQLKLVDPILRFGVARRRKSTVFEPKAEAESAPKPESSEGSESPDPPEPAPE